MSSPSEAPLPVTSSAPSARAAAPAVPVGVTGDSPDKDNAAAPSSTVPPAAPKARGGGKPRRSKKKAPRAAGGAAPKAAVENEKLTHLVIDSGAIIKGAGMTLSSAAENFWTVPEVVAEIRDKKARHHLQALPFELKLREPSDEAMKFAASFARQTGDLRSLSRVDLRVIALTYMLERQETGASHLRTAPVRAGTKVNSKAKGVAEPTLAPPSSNGPQNEKKIEKVLQGPTAAAQVQAPAGADTDSNGNVGEETAETVAEAAAGAGTAEEDSELGGLCAAVKQAWTDDAAVASEEGTGGGGGEQGEEGDEPEEGGEGDSGSDSDSDSEDEEQGEGGKGAGESRDGSDGDDDDDDDDWEPESNSAGQEKPAAGATATGKPFSAEDFPTLGGESGPVAPAPTPPPAAEGAPAPADAPASSWSLMARSNPAPFKVPAKVDPAPLPAAEKAPASTADSAGHFSASAGGAAAAAATAAASRPRPDGAKAGTSRILSTAAAFGVSGGGGDDDDGEGWVNPSNIKSQKAAGIGLNGPSQSLTKDRGGRRGGGGGGGGAGTAVSSQCRAGCVTTDFAMQNVILQVGLPLLSLDGMAVRRVKQWILRCAACFKTTTEMGRLFCPVCGNASLDRVSCSVNARTGVTHLHLRKNHKVNLRGSKFSIPSVNPAKGRFEGDLLLREDQLLSGIWAQKTRRKEKDVSSMFGEDITGNVGLTVSRSADIVVGYGRKNPNATRGRERRGKKSVKKRL